jgi:hypothetical protein
MSRFDEKKCRKAKTSTDEHVAPAIASPHKLDTPGFRMSIDIIISDADPGPRKTGWDVVGTVRNAIETEGIVIHG